MILEDLRPPRRSGTRVHCGCFPMPTVEPFRAKRGMHGKDQRRNVAQRRRMRHARFASPRSFVTRSQQFLQGAAAAAIRSRLGRWSVKLRHQTHPRHVKAFLPDCLMRFDRDSEILRTRTWSARRNAAPAQKSSRFRVSEHTPPFLPFRPKYRGEEFRAAAPIVEAPLAGRPAIDRSYARAR